MESLHCRISRGVGAREGSLGHFFPALLEPLSKESGRCEEPIAVTWGNLQLVEVRCRQGCSKFQPNHPMRAHCCFILRKPEGTKPFERCVG
eukprot:scaffold207840_cov28-Tisochrysis_lutea.AAC.2